MTLLKSLWTMLKAAAERYPAVVAAYFLIGYFFIAIVRVLIRAKKGILHPEDMYDVFSAIPFMWLLAMSIVNIIHERARSQELKQALTREQEQRHEAEAEIATLRAAERSLQHQINNPLGIITLSIARLKRALQPDEDLLDETNDIENASRRIKTVLTDFRQTQLTS